MEQNNENELKHHGIPGMKWGVRRYQNKDGSLTPAGRKKAAKLKMQYAKITGAKINKPYNLDAHTKSRKPKTYKEMSNDELKEKTTRMRLEADYINATRTLSSLNPKKVSAGRRFMTHVGKNVIAPATTEAGKRYLTDYLTNLSKKQDPYDTLKREVETLELKNRKADAIKKATKKTDPVRDALKDEVDDLELRKRKKKAEDYLSGKTKK